MEINQFFSDLERDLRNHQAVVSVKPIKQKRRKNGTEEFRKYEVYITEETSVDELDYERLKETLFIDEIQETSQQCLTIIVTYTKT